MTDPGGQGGTGERDRRVPGRARLPESDQDHRWTGRPPARPLAILVACGGPLHDYAFLIPADTGAGSVSRHFPRLPAGSRCTVTETENGHTGTVGVVATGSRKKATIRANRSATAASHRHLRTPRKGQAEAEAEAAAGHRLAAPCPLGASPARDPTHLVDGIDVGCNLRVSNPTEVAALKVSDCDTVAAPPVSEARRPPRINVSMIRGGAHRCGYAAPASRCRASSAQRHVRRDAQGGAFCWPGTRKPPRTAFVSPG